MRSNRISLRLATPKHDRRGLLKLLESLSPVAVAAALIVAGFALASSGVEEVHAAGPVTITATTGGAISPPAGPCPRTYGAFTVTQGGNPFGLCGDGVDENTAWTFDFTGDPNYGLCDTAEPLTNAVLTLNLTPQDSLFTNDQVYVGGLPSIPLPPPGPGLGWTGTPPTDIPLAVGKYSMISKNLLTGLGVTYSSADILGVLNAIPGGQIPMGYQDDATINYAQLVLTCGPAPCAAPSGLDISTGAGAPDLGGFNLVLDPNWFLASGPSGLGPDVYGIDRPSSWVPPSFPSAHNWIDPNRTGNAISDPPGSGLTEYVYERSFFAPSSGLVLDFDFAVDNDVVFSLRDPQAVGSYPITSLVALPATPASHFNTLTHVNYSLPGPIPYGTWTLIAQVRNQTAPFPGFGNPVGLLVEGTVKCTSTEAGSITICKEILNIIGSLGPFAFTNVGGSLPPFSLSSDDCITFNNLDTNASPYVFSEAPLVLGSSYWSSYEINCTDGTTAYSTTVVTINLGPGEHVTCTFFNGVITGGAVGGITKLLVDDSNSSAARTDGSGASVPSAPLAAVAASAMAVMGAGLWYGRRRWLR